MKAKFAGLTGVKNEHQISGESDPVFWCCLQRSLLTQMRERGLLTEKQFYGSMELLRKKNGRGEKG